jgi:uncharacterized protein (UPF0333 family)
MKSRAQSSLEVLLIIAGMMVVVVVAITALRNSNSAMASNLAITNAKSACSFITKQSVCVDANMLDVRGGTPRSCNGASACCSSTPLSNPYECCWDGALAVTKQCYLNPTATYVVGQ